MSSPLLTLFVNVFKIFPVPKLDQLGVLCSCLTRPKPSVLSPHFPFFNFVYDLLEKQVDLTGKTINLQSDLLEETSNADSIIEGRSFNDPSTMLQNFTRAVKTDLEPQLQVSVLAAIISRKISQLSTVPQV